jgi:hypothetical protein
MNETRLKLLLAITKSISCHQFYWIKCRMVSAFHILKKPILRNAFTVVLLQEPQRFSWKRKKILPLKQKSTSNILNKSRGEQNEWAKANKCVWNLWNAPWNWTYWCDSPHLRLRLPQATHPFINLCSIELGVYSKITISVWAWEILER